MPIHPEHRQPKVLNRWEWIKYANSFPTITHKRKWTTKSLKIRHKRTYKIQTGIKNPLFPISVPEILSGWITSDNDQIEIVPERIVKVKFEDECDQEPKFKKFETEFNKYHQEFETPIKINRLYDGLRKATFKHKGRDNIKLYFSFGLISGKIGNATYRNFTFMFHLNWLWKVIN